MTVPWAAGLALGAVLLVSAVAKISSRSWPAQAAALGAPGWAAPLVPAVELVVGAALVTHLGYPLAPIVAGLLLLGFSALLMANLAAGRRPRCACFGSRSTRPIGGHSLVRNGLLIALAIIAALA